MELALAALPGVITTCLLAWMLIRAQDRFATEREAEHKAHREEIAHAARALLEQVQMHRVEVDAITASHREQIDRLIAAHRREVADLCQRLQAPQVAVANHVAQTGVDPPSVDLEDGSLLSEIQRRETEVQKMFNSLSSRAEELAAEL